MDVHTTAPSSSSLLVACWNTEWHTATSKRGAALRQALLGHAPDIVCLPEAQYRFLPADYHLVHSHPDSGYPLKPEHSKVTLWSRWPWLDVDAHGSDDLPTGRFVSATTATPGGSIRVVGVCIPYRHAHVSTGRRDRTVWEEHERYLVALPKILERERRHGPVLLLGDFNQRIPRRWVPPRLASMLQHALTGFEVWTAGDVAGLEQPLVCHVAGSKEFTLAERPRGLSRIINGVAVSDHDGMVLPIAISSPQGRSQSPGQ
jgi:hypothetical protein